MAGHHEVAPVDVSHNRSGLRADEEPAEVIPRPMGVTAAVEPGVEHARRHRAQVERGRPEGAVLPPAEVPARVARKADDRPPKLVHAARADTAPVAAGAPPPGPPRRGA